MANTRRRSQSKARKSNNVFRRDRKPSLPSKPIPRRKKLIRPPSPPIQNKRMSRRPHSKARSNPSPIRERSRARNSAAASRHPRRKARSSSQSHRPRSRTTDPSIGRAHKRTRSQYPESLSRRRSRHRRQSRSRSRREQLRSEKRGFLQTVRRKWKNYFSSKKSLGKAKPAESIEQPLKTVEYEKVMESKKENSQKNESNIGKKSLISIIQDSGAFDTLVKTISLCVSTVYETDHEDYYRSSLPDPDSHINVLFSDDALLQKQENNIVTDGSATMRGEPFRREDRVFSQLGHPEGEKVNKKLLSDQSFTAKKSQKYSALYPDFHETMWEFHPSCKIESTGTKKHRPKNYSKTSKLKTNKLKK